MPSGVNFSNATENGFWYPLQRGNTTLGNFVNGSYDTTIQKAKNALPFYNEGRYKPLQIWEIIEIHWRDFAQDVGDLQSFGWNFKSHTAGEITDAQNNLTAAQENVKKTKNDVFNAAMKLASIQDEIAGTEERIALLEPDTSEIDLKSEETGTANIHSPANERNLKQTGGNRATIILLKSTLKGLQKKAEVLTDNLNQAQTDYENALEDLQKAEDALNDLAQSETDLMRQLLTDAYMKSIYTEFLKRFWGYKIGNNNPELWLVRVNSFLGNELPLHYKALENLVNSKDLSNQTTTNGATNAASDNETSASTNSNSSIDTNNANRSGGIATSSSTPQSRLNINAQNIDYANQVANNQGDEQGNSSTNGAENSNQTQSQKGTNVSASNGLQNSINPLNIWDAVNSQKGYFGDLWDKALDYGLFDQTTF